MTRTAAARFLAPSRTFGQAALFAASNGLVSVLGAVGTAVVARHLVPSEFGSFAFATSFLLFVAMFFEFGLFVPAARLAVAGSRNERRELAGGVLVAYAPVGVAFAGTVALCSLFIDHVFGVHAGHALAVAAPLSLGYPFVLVGLLVAQGSDRLHVSSLTSLFAQVLFAGGTAVLVVAGFGMNVTSAVALRSASIFVGAVALAAWLRPRFVAVRSVVATLITHAREYGFRVYVGRLLSIGTYNMDVIMLAALSNARAVGLYVLAGQIANAAGLPVQGWAAALFPRLARQRAIEAAVLRGCWIVGVVGAVAATFAARPFIDLVFSSRYAAAATFVFPLAFAQCVRGVTGVYNTYLTAHGDGAALQNSALILTGANVVLNLLLIPPYGAAGAAWASLGALALNLGSHVFYYRRASAPDN